MAEFTNLKLTKDGEEYLGRALVEPINFTTAIVKLSTQVVDPVDIPTLTALNTISDVFPITQTQLNKSTNTLVISARFNNLDIKSDITINTIGLFVDSNGAEKLIAATTATVPFVVRQFNKTSNFYNLKLSLNISSDSNTPITITDGNFASIDDISRLESDKQNKLKPGRNILINDDGTIETVFQEITDIAQLKGEKGDKGEPFLYKDFTQPQLDALKEPGDKSVTTAKLADKAVTPDKTSFIYSDPRNLVNPETYIEGIYFSTSGAEVPSDLYTSTGFIPVTQDSYIIATPDVSAEIPKVTRVPFYDKDKSFVSIVSTGISASSNLTTVEIPNDGYIRVSVRDEYAHNLVVANAESYDGYHDYMYVSDVRSQPLIKSVGRNELIAKSVSVDKTNFIGYELMSSNYFNKENAILDTFLNNAGHVAMETYFASGMIQSSEDSSWVIYPCRYVNIYDSNMVALSSQNTGSNSATKVIEVPAGGWFEFAGPMARLSSAQVNKGTELEPFEEYKDPIVSFPELSFTETQKNELLAQIDGGIIEGVAPEDGSVTTEKLADNSVTPDKTSFVHLDPRNLVNPKTLTYNTRFDTGGNEMYDATYDATDYIPVTEGTYIIATPDVLDTVTKSSRVPFYDRNKNFVSIVSNGISALAILMTAEIPYDGYIRVPIKKIFLHNLIVAKDGTYDGYYDHTYISDARSQPLIASVGQDELIDKSVSADKTNFIALGKNLFDKTNVDLDSFYTNPPRTTPLANYFTIKEPIELEANTTYTMTNVRQWQLIYYDGTDTSVTNTSNNNATVTFTTTGRCVLYMSGSMSNLDVTQLEVGDESTAYQPYGFHFPSLILTDEQKSGQGGTTPSPTPLVEKDINVTKMSELFILSSDLDGKPIIINTERQGRDNNLFNFRSTSIDGNRIHGNGDDVAPIRTFTTVGANHGYTTIIIVTMVNHGKTQVDRGSVWTDGTTEYTLLRVAGDNLTFACPYSVDSDGVVTSVSINPRGSLTHVSGATNTQSVDVTNRTGGQLYPSVNNQKVDYILDGKVLTADGSYSGDTLQVVESYQIMDYKDIIDWSRANIGEAFANDDIEPVVEIKNTYTFTKGLRVSTSHSLTALKPVSLGKCGFLQAIAIGLSGHKTVRTMPGVSVDGFTFDVGQDLTDYNSDLIISDSNLKDSTVPPAYYTDWLVDSKNNRQYGFSMGYIVDKTNSKNSDRLQNSSNYWDLRSSKKSYPVAIEGITLEAGDYLSFSGFRHYLTAESNEVNNFIVRDSRDAYVYADYSEEQKHVEVSSVQDIGKKIEVLQSDNYTSVNDAVDASGVVYKTTGVGGAIVKLV